MSRREAYRCLVSLGSRPESTGTGKLLLAPVGPHCANLVPATDLLTRPHTLYISQVSWLIQPQASSAIAWARNAMSNSGIKELKELRERAWFLFGPDLPRFQINFDPNNAGPLYFLICLTLGIVVPGGEILEGQQINLLGHDKESTAGFIQMDIILPIAVRSPYSNAPGQDLGHQHPGGGPRCCHGVCSLQVVCTKGGSHGSGVHRRGWPGADSRRGRRMLPE